MMITMKMKMISKIAVFIVILILAVVIFGWKHEMSIDKINDWAETKDLTIVDYDLNTTIIGSPFYYLNDGEHIYRLNTKTADGKTEIWWVRTNLFGYDYEKEK